MSPVSTSSLQSELFFGRNQDKPGWELIARLLRSNRIWRGKTNRLPPEGRLVVIVMDRSIPDGQPMQSAHAIADAAIDRLGPNDLGAVVYTGTVSRRFSQASQSIANGSTRPPT
jgi:hypothetical protein